MNCVYCESERVVNNGRKPLKSGQFRQRYLCNDCGRRFNEVSGTPMARLRTPIEEIERAMKSRSEGLGIRATARVFGKSPSSITLWEERLSEVRANHNEAQNSALRRKATAYRRRQNHYAKVVEGLQRALNVQRLLHNWVCPHWGHGGKRTPAMAMGFIERPVTIPAEAWRSQSLNCS